MSARAERIEKALAEHTLRMLKAHGLSAAMRDLRFIRQAHGEAVAKRVEIALAPELAAARRGR